MAGDTDVQTSIGKERRRDLGDGSTAPLAIPADGDGNVYDSTNLASVRLIDPRLPLKVPAVSQIYGEDLHAVNGAFAGTPELVYNADAALWTASAPVGAGNFTAASGEQNHTPAGTNSAKWTTPNVGDTINFDSGGSLDLSDYVALTFWVYISSGYSVGDTIVVYGWDGALEGLEIDIAPKINILQPGVWQLVDIPLTEMGLEASTITDLRLRYTAKTGQAPTVYFDDFQFEETSGEEPFIIAAPPGTLFSIARISVTILGTNAIAPLVDPNTLFDEPALTNGIIIQTWLGGAPATVQDVIRDFCDFYDSDFEQADVGFHGGGNSCLKLELEFDSPLKFSTPATWMPGDPFTDFLIITVRDNLTVFDRIRAAAFGSIEFLPPP